jgi:simple sugar transport system substrate-binding protein
VVCETAAARGAFVCGYHADQTPLAGDMYLTGAEWNWASIYVDMVEKTMAGAPIDNFVRGGLADDFIKMSPLGPAVSDASRAQFEATKAEIIAGGFAAIKGPLNDNNGNLIVPAGQSILETDVAVESMGYLVEGVLGSVG